MKNTIVIPTYNERENIAPLIGAIFKILPNINILVVDDNSPDKTGEKVKELMRLYKGLDLLERPQKDGLGGAYVTAFKSLLSNGDIESIITMDGDFSHNPKYIPKLIEANKNSDLVIGSRYAKGGGVAEWELWRKLLSRGGNFYVRSILGRQIHDWTAGFQCINTGVLNRIDLDSIDLSGYAFLQELKYKLIKQGARVVEVPIIFESRRGGESKISRFIIREGIIGPWKIRAKK